VASNRFTNLIIAGSVKAPGDGIDSLSKCQWCTVLWERTRLQSGARLFILWQYDKTQGPYLTLWPDVKYLLCVTLVTCWPNTVLWLTMVNTGWAVSDPFS